MKKNVRILDGSYSTFDEDEKDGVKIELYGKTEGHQSVTIIYEDFNPYFKLVEPDSSLVKNISRDSEVVSVDDEHLWVEGKKKHCKKFTIKHPWKVPNYKKMAKDSCQVLDADIPFVQRFMFDFDISSSVTVRGNEIKDHDYTTDVVIKAEEFENCRDFYPEIKVMGFDIENSIESDDFYVISTVTVVDDKKTVKSFTGKDKTILEDFVEYVKKEDPDVLTGYNIEGYDFPEIQERADSLNVWLGIGRNGDRLRKRGNRQFHINGRIIADAWWGVKSEMDLKRETLNHVANELFGEGKVDVDSSKIDREWQENKEKVIEYCEKDTDLSVRILNELGIIQKAMDLATVSMLPVEECLNFNTSTLIDSILIRKAINHKIGVPLNKYDSKGGRSVEGGFVYQPDAGIHPMVTILDFKSMYPSVIMNNNICITTLADMDETLPAEGTYESPTGAKFYSEKKRKGILPEILSGLMDERDKMKKKRDELDDPKASNYYDRLQGAIKVVMNSFYGVFASSFYRFTNPKIGESITAFARENIKEVISELEGRGLEVVYSDTDSVFYKSPYPDDLEKTIEHGEEVGATISDEYMILELEKIVDPFYTHGKKKRYIGKIIWPEEDMMVKGYETTRSDSFDAQDEALKAVFEKILDNDTDGAVQAAREHVGKVKKGNIDIEKLVISTKCKKFSYYKNPDEMTQVQVAKKIKNDGYQFTPGQRISWIITDSSKTPQEAEPWYEGEEFKHEPDYKYYADRVAKTLARITKSFGWEKRALMMGTEQTTLF